jgi:hypothetical protein
LWHISTGHDTPTLRLRSRSRGTNVGGALLVAKLCARYFGAPPMSFEIEMFTRGVDYARFARMYYGEPFQGALVHAINLKERKVLEREALPDGKQRFVVYIAPRVELPAIFASLAHGYAIGYEETTLFDPVARRAQSFVKTPGGDLLRVSAETLFSESASGVHTKINVAVRAKILGISAPIEKFVANETRKRYALVERALQTFLDEGRDLEPTA